MHSSPFSRRELSCLDEFEPTLGCASRKGGAVLRGKACGKGERKGEDQLAAVLHSARVLSEQRAKPRVLSDPIPRRLEL